MQPKSIRRFGGFFVGAALCALAGAASAAATRPDFEGMWVVQPAYHLGKPLSPPPEFSARQTEENRRRAAARPEWYVRSAGNMLCIPSGGPSLFAIRSPFTILEGAGRVTFIFETEGQNQPRTVYIDKAHGPDIYPSFNGHSVGRWEGSTLVVDTIGYNGRGMLFNGVPKTEKTHTVERITWSPDGKEMTVALTVEDPDTLARPWTASLKFDRMPPDTERFEVWCEPDLDAFKALDLKAVKDADPEVARLLDPDLRPSDPALAVGQ